MLTNRKRHSSGSAADVSDTARAPGKATPASRLPVQRSGAASWTPREAPIEPTFGLNLSGVAAHVGTPPSAPVQRQRARRIDGGAPSPVVQRNHGDAAANGATNESGQTRSNAGPDD